MTRNTTDKSPDNKRAGYSRVDLRHGHDTPARPAEESTPLDKTERERIRSTVRHYVTSQSLVPPLSIEDLQAHSQTVLTDNHLAPGLRDFITVLISNEMWSETLAGIPYERRVLLLPQCLRSKQDCPATLDEFGLLCEQCGRCPTGELQAEAEALGYVVLVAEGTTVVTKLLEQGRVDAVIGVSCLSVLEKAFPPMASHAIPGVAIPLFRNGCDNTQADWDWIREAIHLKSDLRWLGRIDIDRLRSEVDRWFQLDRLRPLLGPDGTQTETIALDWLRRAGKRWRPVLSVCAFKALTGAGDETIPPTMQKLAVAMECFHKASLIHDDIEDADELRYGEKTLHQQHGVPIALNVGDFLLGEGYRLIAECGAPPNQIAQMLAVAAEGHRSLCLGQGAELSWMRDPAPLTARQVLELFRRKTAPAFEVALRLGAICGGANGEISRVLKQFSESLGIAFQIKDDLEDGSGHSNDADARRPSILYALAFESATGAAKECIAEAWREGADRAQNGVALRQLFVELHSEEKARQLLEHYKNDAIRSLSPLDKAQLKSLLRRLVGKILGAA